MRRKSREVKIGSLRIGGINPIAVQSMCKTKTKDVAATIRQIKQLEEAGCEIIRLGIPDLESAKALKEIRKNISIPLVADIHFDYKLAVESAKYADKLRINPGNIGSPEKVKAVVDSAKDFGIPIRIGVNSGSIERDLVEKYGLTAEAMAESALRHVKILEELGFYDIVVSLKASDVARTIEAYEMIAYKTEYPLHLGITEAGTSYSGIIKSSIGIGALLSRGIGDTIRVSLTEDPVEEVKVAYDILKALEIRRKGLNLISCPTCGRTEIDSIKLAKEVEAAL